MDLRKRIKKSIKDINSIYHNESNEYDFQKSRISIIEFIDNNLSLFAIIGITGTLLSLLPNFMDKVIGPDWKIQLLSNTSGIISLVLFQTCIISGVFFILFLSELIILKLFEKNPNEKGSNYPSKIGNEFKFIFLLLFVLPIGSLIFFISTIFFVQTDPFLQFFQMLINFVIFLLFLLISIITICLKFEIEDGVKNGIFVLLILLFIAALYIIIAGLLPGIVVGEYKGSFIIYPDKISFNPNNSSDLGIKFDIIGVSQNQTNFDALYRRFTWSTNYGYFIVDDPNSYTIMTKKQEITLKEFKKVFWAYDFHDVGFIKPPVKIYLNIWDERTKNTVVGNSTNIIWLGKDTATIQ